jgi:hypothetical protein
MSACYDTKAFRESCPYDQDIILHYEGKVQLKPLGKQPTLQRPSTTLTVPNLTHILNGSTHEDDDNDSNNNNNDNNNIDDDDE